MPILTLGQSGSASSMLIWIIILIAFVLIGGLVIFNLRRRMLMNDDSISTGSSGLMDHIRELHQLGEIDDDEFSRARNAILRQVQDDVEAHKNASKDTAKNAGDPFLDGLDIDL